MTQNRPLSKWEEEQEAEENRIIREGGRSYLLRAIEGMRHPEKTDEEERERFLALQIEGLLPCTVRYRNGAGYYYYDITGRQAICSLYKEAEMSYGECCGLILSLERTLQNIREYLLNENGLCLTADMVFMNVNKNEAIFAYDPAQGSCFQEEVRALAEFILNHIEQRDDRAVVLSCQFYKYTLAENFNIEEFLLENRHYILLGEAGEPVKTNHQENVPYDGGNPQDTAPEEEYYELWLP